MKKALIFGILASMFFAFTFVFNRSINLAGGYWGWSASLRYFFMLPMLWIASAKSGGIRPILNDIKLNPAGWILWSTVGFGLLRRILVYCSNMAAHHRSRCTSHTFIRETHTNKESHFFDCHISRHTAAAV